MLGGAGYYYLCIGRVDCGTAEQWRAATSTLASNVAPPPASATVPAPRASTSDESEASEFRAIGPPSGPSADQTPSQAAADTRPADKTPAVRVARARAPLPAPPSADVGNIGTSNSGSTESVIPTPAPDIQQQTPPKDDIAPPAATVPDVPAPPADAAPQGGADTQTGP